MACFPCYEITNHVPLERAESERMTREGGRERGGEGEGEGERETETEKETTYKRREGRRN